MPSLSPRVQKVALAALAVILAVLAWRLWFPDLDRQAIIAFGEDLPHGIFLGTFIVLPMLGVPISVFLVAAGLKYGTGWGMAVATVATGVHNLAAFVATKTWFQSRIEHALNKLGHTIPQIPNHHQWWFTAIFTGVPGLPYAIKLYSLALTNISFRIYFWIGWPMYAVSCIVYVVLGAAAATLSIGWFIAVLLFGLALLGGVRWYCGRRGLKS